VRLLKVLDRNRRVTAVPFQKSGIPASVGLTLEECRASTGVSLASNHAQLAR
jgi:hypothetical protein